MKSYYFKHNSEDKGFPTFYKGTCPKKNIIAWLEFEHAYNDSAVHRCNYFHNEDTRCF